jgi:hypothetical protein
MGGGGRGDRENVCMVRGCMGRDKKRLREQRRIHGQEKEMWERCKMGVGGL